MTDKESLSLNVPNLETAKILGDLPKIIFEKKILDPISLTYVGTIWLGNTRTISIHGQWSPGPTRPYWGPGGDRNTIFMVLQNGPPSRWY